MGRPDPLDLRSALVLVEPIFHPPDPQMAPDGVRWHGMAFVNGQTVNNIKGMDRTVVLEDCIDAVAAAGVDVETEPISE